MPDGSVLKFLLPPEKEKKRNCTFFNMILIADNSINTFILSFYRTNSLFLFFWGYEILKRRNIAIKKSVRIQFIKISFCLEMIRKTGSHF